mmetsp:Transcript_28298/g.34974  ORF Transcript_28298/g.34974 Transcript_28298/m.34974 type:complete len:422 (-) Transcript_28298:146-1411(-)
MVSNMKHPPICRALVLLHIASTSNAFSSNAIIYRHVNPSFTFEQVPVHVLSPSIKNQRKQFSSVSESSSSSTSTSSSLKALPLPMDIGLEDLIYNIQSKASQMASSTFDSTSSSSSTSIQSLAILYFAGLLTSFSPCSLGLLPLTISYISSAAGERDDKAVFLPTVAFALGLAAVFCGVGLSVSLLGNGVFGSSGDGDYTIGSIILAVLSSGVSIAMGLQLLELINIPLPSLEIGDFSSAMAASSSSASAVCSNGVCRDISYEEDENGKISIDEKVPFTSSSDTSNSNGALFRTFLLGGSSALVASPCATPVLTAILGFVAASRDPILGAILLFIYTVGYSTPLLIVGASGGQALANAQVAAAATGDDDGNEGSIFAKIGLFVNPLTASILIWYGTNGLLEFLFGDPSMSALAPVLLDYEI